MGLSALNLQSLEGLSLAELVARFPRPPVVAPTPSATAAAGASEGTTDDDSFAGIDAFS